MAELTETDIRESVRERYAAAAKRGSFPAAAQASMSGPAFRSVANT